MSDIVPANQGVPFTSEVNTTVPLIHLQSHQPQEVIAIVGANVINTMLYIAGGLTILYLFYAGSQFMTSQGDSGKVETAKHKLLNAILGIVAITMSLFIVRLIRSAIVPMT